MKRLGPGLVLVVACTRAAPPPTATGARGARGREDAMTQPATATRPALTITLLDTIARRPPMTELSLELRASNPSGAPRWILVPRDVGQPIGGGGVDVLEPFAWAGAGAAITIGSFQGTGGFFALWLGPSAEVVVRGLTVRWFRDDLEAAPPPFTAIIAAGVTVGGQPAETWFAASPLVTGAATVERPTLTGSVRFRPDSTEVPVALVEPVAQTVTLR